MYHKTAKKFPVGQLILCILLFIGALACFLPMLLVVIAAFSSERSIAVKGFSFFPIGYSLDGFKYVFTFIDQVLQSYMVTILETVIGTAVSLFLTSMFAFALSRKDFMLNRFFAFYLLVTMLFSGGMLASYLVNTGIWGMRNNVLVLILPGAISVMNCIVMRTFITANVPISIIESAKMDGAGEFYLFIKIVMPILVPVIAAIGYMTAIGHWNEWQTAFLYIDDPDLATLQLMLIRIEKNLQFLQERLTSLTPEELVMLKNAPSQTARMAILLCTLGPIMFAYPFFQKYFVKGITVGSVKG